MEPTSEQELKELLDEDKISEEEYQQLLEALHQKQKPQQPAPVETPADPTPTTGNGKTALILMIIAIVLPFIGFAAGFLLSKAESPRVFLMLILPSLLISFLCGIFAFIFGIIGFKSPAGKIAALGVPCLGLLVIVILPVIFLLGARATSIPSSREARADIRAMVLLKIYPLNSMDGVLTQDAVLDEQISADGDGSLRMQTQSVEKTVFRLFETGPMEIEDKMLIYSAKLKSQLQEGRAYLEMWCEIPGKGEFFSRGMENPVTGTTEWTNVQTPFRLETGQMPANVKLNLVIEGTGTVWIDDIRLFLSPM